MPEKKGTKKTTPRVLLIEDDEFMIKILEREFKTHGVSNFRFVREGEKAADEFNVYNPDVVVLDILLPGKSGLDALRDIRKLKAGKNIPVYVLSNYGTDEYREQALKLGVREYLLKSNTMISDLVEKLKALK
ncbi:MAG: hypothetical protein A3H69_05650 [Candidatus Sungbacteria bacterium RIFCSPLOWO2_02_FULL_47_9]|uniref:Response regulatory domain-containing protein n=1 Tax=Candidatus Sungbacteria bacterium RIFCSPHIGHO2_01_FULL_47_32 TaxID=1802264 RepID=A0A1G2KAE6_9BACT|nr:MAG: Response regulator receiver protein [Parcubacteria group bacterium GW2011_GWA2_47_10]OGZ95501.1 MAG: hypothetical protein A2633_05080 [Candidatus Sungbacteria bacterium RIFCSPHIGHO2_01_FULL_47_32]OGZ98100.1 MAG: hypothetical protein A3D57_00490 [Candidatus Sungbacteria bacterium RIFCSPHIGHO2_02_FULL_46_12]OHA05958.1 MAG: hypothetical protein A3A28_03405 [Candidatus Sungbacteria bacterium RIFCSPLOWO2_01_FULL_47_32]OHA09917.1 MAG: hypothetical protein A3H69_05650 [Candidatus Sungbacteria 